jgi:hemerythrin
MLLEGTGWESTGLRRRMALITWSNKYSVGVQNMDKQHTVLFDILNELHESMMKGQAQSVAGKLLRKLTDYTRTHFSAEEAMMAAANFPGLGEHRLKHQNLIKQVSDYAARLEKGDISLYTQLLTFVRDWLGSHIQKEDKEYGVWMNEHGIH